MITSRDLLVFLLYGRSSTQSFFEFLARSESRSAAFGDFNGCTRAWITTCSCLCAESLSVPLLLLCYLDVMHFLALVVYTIIGAAQRFSIS
jgi:hypothetical protein